MADARDSMSHRSRSSSRTRRQIGLTRDRALEPHDGIHQARIAPWQKRRIGTILATAIVIQCRSPRSCVMRRSIRPKKTRKSGWLIGSARASLTHCWPFRSKDGSGQARVTRDHRPARGKSPPGCGALKASVPLFHIVRSQYKTTHGRVTAASMSATRRR